MYSDVFPDHAAAAERVGSDPPAGLAHVRGLLEKRAGGADLDGGEIAVLLGSLGGERERALVMEFAASLPKARETTIFLLPPLYFSSLCENGCPYCEFTSAGRRLALAEFEAELDALLETGYRSLELVSGQDPGLYVRRGRFEPGRQAFDAGEAIRYFALARQRLDAAGGGMLTSNIPPLDGASLAGLRAAGLDCYLSWAECFNPARYSRLHPAAVPKGDQAFRLNAFEAARAAGIPHLAGAFLKGLYDWRKEEVVLYLFDRYLRERAGRGFTVIGTPRLKGAFARSADFREHLVSDEDYELNIALDRILFDGRLWLQTREPAALNLGLVRRFGAGVVMTLDCSTAPGGYSRPARARAQFPVHRQNLAAAVQALRDEGFDVRFAWTADDLEPPGRTP